MSHTWKDRKRYFLKELWKGDINSFYTTSEDHLNWPVPSWFKKMNTRIRRAKVKDAMRNGNYDCLPRFRKENSWLWW